MDKKNISPNPQQPVDRVPSGQLPSALAELSEEALASQVQAADWLIGGKCDTCSFDGDDE
ncbi:MAG: microcyclamide/patellamide family RiPP [Oscillatoria sp. SIO1A7]|nr:microcyclamide/patellamide family RiPP [Oscillatoria sp. SIO1A7]